ncbi:MAG: protein translocase subunit SecF [bacterium]
MFVVKYRKIFYSFTALLVAFSIFSVSYWGLNLGIDFKGGAIAEVEYQNRPAKSDVEASIKTLNFGEFSVRPTGDNAFIIRTRDLTNIERQQFITSIGVGSATTTASSTISGATLKRFDSVGPVLGQELAQKSTTAIIFVIIAIVLFITFAFRGVSEPVSSFKYGLVAVVALVHDVIVPTGIYAFLGRNGGFEVDALFVTAILVILGFSVHDTIVVFDRTRENLKHAPAKKPFYEIVGESISQTFARSINTSLTTVLALIALFVFGPEATRNFSLVMMIGIIVGTYSSIFLGSPLLVTIQKMKEKKGK